MMRATGSCTLPPRARRREALRDALRNRFGVRVIPDPRTLSPAPRGRHPSHGRGVHSIALAAALLLAAALGLAPRPAHAGTWRLDANLASIHTERWARDSLNQRNPGVGIEYQVNRTWGASLGVYSNSYRRLTRYALAEWTPLHIGPELGWHLDAGVAGGIASGYTRAEVPCAPLAAAALVRAVAPDGVALNVFGVPNTGGRSSGFIGFQLAVPLP